MRLQLLEILEFQLHEWRGSNDKQKKKNVGQVYDHLDRGLDALDQGETPVLTRS